MTAPPPDLSPLKRALVEIRDLRSRLDLLERGTSEPLAVVGIGCRFPGGASDPRSFWELLREGRDATSETPADRWDNASLFDPDPDAPGKVVTRRGGFLDRIDLFDAGFFGITPREAVSMDPQHRLLLEVSYEALEDAGESPEKLRGSDTGVFVGIGTNDYLQLRSRASDLKEVDAYLATGTSHSVASGRISFFYGFEGPCLSVDTACSSSLVAAHLAISSLRAGECSMALVGGVSAIAAPDLSVNFSRARMLAPDGRCKTFDASADGYARGEGCGVIVLKRLSNAIRSRDRIYALLRGSAVNQDGRSSGLTVPNGPAQEALMRRALRNAGVAPREVDYVEAHGTGTSLGDPIEIQALSAAYGSERDRPLVVGSVKTNLGHLEAASGIAGLLKVVLALVHEEMPPHLHVEELNPRVAWKELPVVVGVERSAWPRTDRTRFAGVSSFGFSGTNAHVIASEAPVLEPDESPVERPLHVLALSARSEAALSSVVDRAAARLADSRVSFEDICFTAGTGRSHFEHRIAVVAGSAGEARKRLASAVRGRVRPGSAPAVAFLFTGQGSQYHGMGRSLFETSPLFRESLERSASILRPVLGESLQDVLYDEETSRAHLDRTRWTQPALFALEHALATLWLSWGVEPAYVFGHSIGEYAAAVSAGSFDLETGLQLVAERGRLMDGLPEGGAMAAVFAPESVAAEAAKGHPSLALAAVNGASNVVISGKKEELEALLSTLGARGIESRRLNVSHAFHSPLVEPSLGAFENQVRKFRIEEPAVALVSSITGRLAERSEVKAASYWRRQTRETVRFAEAVETLRAEGVSVFVEIGPSPVLCEMAAASPGELWLPSLSKGRDDWETILETFSKLYTRGAPVSFDGLDRSYRRRRVSLPTYPFERERFWIETSTSGSEAFEAARDAAIRAAASGAEELALSYRVKWAALDRLSSAYLSRVFQDLGWFRHAGEEASLDDIVRGAEIRDGYRALLGRWLDRLASEGILVRKGSRFVLESPTSLSVAETLESARSVFGDDRALLDYVTRFGESLALVLQGRESPLELLFPEGSFDSAEALYERQPLSRYLNGILAAAVAGLARLRRAERLEVLEIGAGTGSATAAVAPMLPPGAARYLFTDVSDLFLARAQKRFALLPFMSYAQFDVERDPEEQGLPKAGFDLVLASNVLHATRRLEETVDRVRDLLAPGGLLFLCEGTRNLSYLDVTWALIDGWRLFEDDREGSPLRPRDWWEAKLRDHGFDRVSSFPSNGAAGEVLGQHVFLARRDAAGSARPSRERAVEPAVDVDFGNDRSVSTELLRDLDESLPSERLGKLVAFVRNEVAAVMRASPEKAPGRLDRLMDRGLDSLMAVELRNRLGRALGLGRRLPSTLIFEHPTILAVAELLLRELAGIEARTSRSASAAADAIAVERAAKAVEDLTEEEMEALLRRKVDSL